MAAPDQEYRSLMLRKVQQVAAQHGGISNIPRELQTKLGFDIIAGRKGSFSISVRIPDGDLSSRIAELKSELPKITFESAKPEPERIFGKYVPQVSEEDPTMDDFWIMQGWYKEDRAGIRLIRAKWEENEKARADAVRFLVEKVLKKDPRGLTTEDFRSNRLSGLIDVYGCSIYLAVVEAGYAYSIKEALEHAKEGAFRTEKLYPWEMGKAPQGLYDSKENRVAATKWLIAKLQKDPRELSQEDFNSRLLAGLLSHYYSNSPHAALTEAGYQINPWEMQKTPMGFYELEENRVAAVKWLVQKLQKDPRGITQEDFYSNRLSGLLTKYYLSSPYEALLEAGLATPEDEAYMRGRSNTKRDAKGRYS